MTYWKGLLIAAAFDLVWSMARPATLEPPQVPPLAVVVEMPESPTHDLDELGNLEDSLMSWLHEHPHDVDVMARLSDFYASQGWWEAAINPLARALELDPSRRDLWVALDRAVAGSGREKITDKELVERAAAFADQIDMFGDGC
jgi:cytochrome c-type biogenesis protein CcmH/NrfG